MAIGKKTGGRDFLPGNAFGKGRPPMPAELRQAMKAARWTVYQELWSFSQMTIEELNKVRASPDTPALRLAIMNVFRAAVFSADERSLGFVLDRLMGPVGKLVEVIHSEEISDSILEIPTFQPVEERKT